MNGKFIWLISLCFLLLLSSCSPDSDFKKLHGTWTNGSIQLIFPDNSTIQISTDRDSIPEYSGTYSINGSDMFIEFTSEKIPDSCGGEGKYNYTINEIALNFDLERDDCPFRKKEFENTFKKIK
jgi:hypothetical protein